MCHVYFYVMFVKWILASSQETLSVRTYTCAKKAKAQNRWAKRISFKWFIFPWSEVATDSLAGIGRGWTISNQLTGTRANMRISQARELSVQRHRRFIDMILFLSLRHVMLIVWNLYRYTKNNAFKHLFTSVIKQKSIIILIIMTIKMMMTIIIA